VIVRIWTTQVDAEHVAEYERFAELDSLPMFRMQSGNLGVIFTRTGTACGVVSFWDSMSSVDSLAQSPSYQSTVARIAAAGFLVGEATTASNQAHGGWISELLAEAVRSSNQQADVAVSSDALESK
jgi:heme-degrading monooxygenase HmoA